MGREPRVYFDTNTYVELVKCDEDERQSWFTKMRTHLLRPVLSKVTFDEIINWCKGDDNPSEVVHAFGEVLDSRRYKAPLKMLVPGRQPFDFPFEPSLIVPNLDNLHREASDGIQRSALMVDLLVGLNVVKKRCSKSFRLESHKDWLKYILDQPNVTQRQYPDWLIEDKASELAELESSEEGPGHHPYGTAMMDLAQSLNRPKDNAIRDQNHVAMLVEFYRVVDWLQVDKRTYKNPKVRRVLQENGLWGRVFTAGSKHEYLLEGVCRHIDHMLS